MIIYNFIVLLVDSLLIKGMFISVLMVMAAGKLFNNGSARRYAINILRLIMISYAVLLIAFYLGEFYISYFSGGEYTQYSIKRATGPYWYAFWLMTGSNTVLPLLLLIRRLARNIYFILLVAVLMNIGWLMEFLVLHYHSGDVPYTDLWLNILKGAIVGIMALFAGNMVKDKTQPVTT